MNFEHLKKCMLCPRKCGINRYETKGFCQCDANIKIARADLHYFEEPPISGTKGSGTVFFSGCNLKCVFCQNYGISYDNFGKYVTNQRLAEIFLELQKKGAHNINLVTPTPYIINIIEAIKIAKENGLDIPIIYNCSGYESVWALKLLEGYIDVYLPDMKYWDNEAANKYSKCNNYLEICMQSLEEMYRQVGPIHFDENNIIKKGVMVRHLVMPNMTNDSKKIIYYLHNTYKDNIYISIMNQYTPNKKLKNYKEIDRSIKPDEYNEVVDYAIEIGVVNAFIQEEGTTSDSFIPEFDLTGV